MKLVRTVVPSILFAALVACGGDDSKQAKSPDKSATETSYQSTTTTSSTPPNSDATTNANGGPGSTSSTTASGVSSTDSNGGNGAGSVGSTSGPGSTGGAAGAAGTTSTTFTDNDIAAITASVNTGEVEEGKLAQKKAKDAKVKAFAGKMIQHHTAANTKQADLLKKLKMSTSENPTSRELASDGANTLEQLKTPTGADFDKAYIDAQVKAHQNALSLLDEKLIPQAKSSELKQMLQTVRSQVDSHLREATDIQKSLGTK